jgi:hypothetical protein
MMRHTISFITPLFSKGSYDDRPEVRAPSIRGQLHWWFRALGGNAQDENAIFGSVHTKPVLASKIVVRVAQPHDGNGGLPQKAEINTLPHKAGGQASPKWAFRAGTTFDLVLTERLGGLSDSQRRAFRRAVDAWLLLGTLGLRATRACGSFLWRPFTSELLQMPQSLDDWKSFSSEVLGSAPLKFHIADTPFDNAEEARRVISDTIGGDERPGDWLGLGGCNWPLGNVSTRRQKEQNVGAPKRKTSPLRFRIVPVSNRFYIAAVWDDRSVVTGNHSKDLNTLITMLVEKNKPIGTLLRDFR